jgi:hypothetical protein
MAGRISMGARREVLAAVAGRYRSARPSDKGRILDELCAMTVGIASMRCAPFADTGPPGRPRPRRGHLASASTMRPSKMP